MSDLAPKLTLAPLKSLHRSPAGKLPFYLLHGGAGGPADPDEGRRRVSCPISVPDQPQPPLQDRASAISVYSPVLPDDAQRLEVPQRRTKAGAPYHRVDGLLRAVRPHHAPLRETLEGPHALQGTAVPGLPYGGHHHDVT